MNKKLYQFDSFINEHRSVFLSVCIVVMTILISVTLYSWKLVYISYIETKDLSPAVSDLNSTSDNENESDFDEAGSLETTEAVILENLDRLKMLSQQSSSTEITPLTLEDHQAALERLAALEDNQNEMDADINTE